MKKYIYIIILLAAPWYLGAQTLTIGTDAVVTIGVDASISVGTAASSGTLTNTSNTGLIIESDANGSGSLICGGTPNATVKRYVKTDRWNMVTPSTSGTTGQTFADASGSDSWLVEFDESAGTGSDPGTGWSYITALSTSTPVGTGYSYYPSVNETVEFAGNLNTANLSPTLTYSGSGYGYNLVGNPFTSALIWDDTWTLSNMEGSIWIYDGTQYQTYTAATTFNIPAGQGFFMKANASSPSAIIPASKRVHNSQPFLKSGSEVKSGYEDYLVITALNNQYTDKIQVSFGENGTDGFDNGWDGSKMFGSIEAPQLYVNANANMLSYNHLPLLSAGEERTVYLGYVPGAEGSQQLSADVNHLDIDYLLLEDLQSGSTHNFMEDPNYNFIGTKEDNPDRFRLKFSHTAFGIEDDPTKVSDIKIYASGSEIRILSFNEMKKHSGEVFVFDMLGSELLQTNIPAGELFTIRLGGNTSYIIVKVTKAGEIKTEKLWISL